LTEGVGDTCVGNKLLVMVTEGIGSTDVTVNGFDITDTKLLYAVDIVDLGNSVDLTFLLTIFFGAGFRDLSSCTILLMITSFLLISISCWALSVVVLV
jgi:hypothetical protein